MPGRRGHQLSEQLATELVDSIVARLARRLVIVERQASCRLSTVDGTQARENALMAEPATNAQQLDGVVRGSRVIVRDQTWQALEVERHAKRIPAGRNPFTYFNRAIVFTDTLKNPSLWRKHLERVRWDLVWIDESHKLVNRDTYDNALAHVLAPNADALTLTSATGLPSMHGMRSTWHGAGQLAGGAPSPPRRRTLTPTREPEPAWCGSPSLTCSPCSKHVGFRHDTAAAHVARPEC